MKRILSIFLACAVCAGISARAQDAATTERLNKLNGLVQDLQETKEAQRKHIENLAKEIQNLRENMSKQPKADYASQESVTELAKKLQEIDRKRVEDNERILKEIEKLGKKMTVANASGGPKPPKTGGDSGKNDGDGPKANTGGNTREDGFEYTIQSGDYLSTIVAAYNKEGVKVTTDQVLKANPGLDPQKLKVGKTIWIPGKKSK